MVYRPTIDPQLCFVLMPFKEPFNGYYEQLIKPTVSAAGLICLRADEIYGTRPIVKDIWTSIWQARLVIADVTEKNPNVNYELGLCHCLGVPTILVTKKEEDVPFDYRHHRYIRYDTDLAGWESRFTQSLRKTIDVELATSEPTEQLPWPYNTYFLKNHPSQGQLVLSETATDIVVGGMLAAQKPVARAIGPRGTHTSFNNEIGSPTALRSGKAILQKLKSANPLENRGLIELQTLTREMSDQVGDFSKTALLLACAILEASRPAVAIHPLSALIQGIDVSGRAILAYMDTQRQETKPDDLLPVAVTAANGNRSSAAPVVEAMKKVGASGLIYVEQGSGPASTLEVREGMEFDRGYLSAYFVTDPERNECILESPLVLLHEGKISSMKEIIGLLESIAKAGKPILIIADEIEGEALSTLVVNKLRGTLQCAAVKSPGFSDRRVATLEDIAIVTGGRFFSRDIGVPLSSVRIEDLGTAKRVQITKDRTAIFDGGGKPDVVAERAQGLRREIQSTLSDFDKAKLQERLANIAGGIAVIRTGGLIFQEVIDEQYRVQSALHSVFATTEEGWIPGGGITLFNAARSLETLSGGSEGANAGIGIMRTALEAPIRALIATTNESPTKVLAQLKEAQEPSVGYNVQTSGVEDLAKAGIIDPVKSVRLAVTLAVAHAKAVLQTGAWELEEVEKRKDR